MTLREALASAQKALAGAGIDDAALESETLLQHALQISRVRLYLDLDRALTTDEERSYSQVMERRLRHEPAAYITGHCEFYGLDFLVDPAVLIPRSATELIVEDALAWVRGYSPAGCLIAETGVGSGIIAVSLAKHLPAARIVATDISEDALRLAAGNCRRHGVTDRVTLLCGDLLAPVSQPVDLVVANLPYIPSADLPSLMPEIRLYEPALALDGGADGLDIIRRLVAQLPQKLRSGGGVILEVGEGQAEEVVRLLGHAFPGSATTVVPDWGGAGRVVKMTAAVVAAVAR